MWHPDDFLLMQIGRLLLPLSLFVIFPAHGETELIAFSGYRLSGDFEDISSATKVSVDEDNVRGFIIDVDDRPGAAYEFLYSKQSSRLRSSAGLPDDLLFDIEVEYIHMGGILLRQLSPRQQGFFGAGIGFTRFSPGLSGVSSETEPSLSVTAGLKFTLTRHLGLRLDIRAYGTSVNSNTAIFCSNGSCALRFSGDMFTQFEGSAGLVIRF